MNRDRIIALTNRISLVAIVLLLYWVFIFISITVFDFKVFKENITESFYLSVFGILALLSGAVIVNVMFNLTKISEVMSGNYKKEEVTAGKKKRPLMYVGLFSFPLIFGFLYWGDIRTSNAKENYLVDSAKYIVENNEASIREFSRFSLDSTYLSNTRAALSLLSKEFESFPSVSIISMAEHEGKDVFIYIGPYSYGASTKTIADFAYSCSVEEKLYLSSVFKGTNTAHRFSASDGNYELYYPVDLEQIKLVLYCTDSQQYGKLGS